MSTTYSVVCDDCELRFELGYTSQGSDLRVLNPQLWNTLKEEHSGHQLRITNDLVDDEHYGIEEYTDATTSTTP